MVWRNGVASAGNGACYGSAGLCFCGCRGILKAAQVSRGLRPKFHTVVHTHAVAAIWWIDVDRQCQEREARRPRRTDTRVIGKVAREVGSEESYLDARRCTKYRTVRIMLDHRNLPPISCVHGMEALTPRQAPRWVPGCIHTLVNDIVESHRVCKKRE